MGQPGKPQLATDSAADPGWRHVDEAATPGWVAAWLAAQETKPAEHAGDGWRLLRGRRWSFLQVYRPRLCSLPAARFEAAIADAYHQLRVLLDDHGLGRPVRFWNFVPRLLEEVSPGRNRYMVFNAGRRRAFDLWHGAPAGGGAAASAVDGRGPDLLIQVLAGDVNIAAIENPRQRPAYQYSSKFGPVPPSFCRASLVPPAIPSAPAMLITAGTASVVGEDTHHEGDLDGQLEQTEINLAALVATATLPRTTIAALEQSPAQRRLLLEAYSHLRAYVVHTADEPTVLRWLRQSFPGARHIELMSADLCRPQLLVEVEGVAALPIIAGAYSPALVPGSASH